MLTMRFDERKDSHLPALALAFKLPCMRKLPALTLPRVFL
jgi:hypothetical protein